MDRPPPSRQVRPRQLLLFGVMVAGCLSPVAVDYTGKSCEEGDCPTGYYCDPGSRTCQGGEGPAGCEVVGCGAGEVCARGACVPRSCPGEPCREGEQCSSGRCAPLDCAGVSCAWDQRCAMGTCFAAACASGACGEREVCLQGACVDALCVPVNCRAGERCAAGRCYEEASCGSAGCGEGRVCVDGECVEARCVGVVCGARDVCIGGRCQACAGSGPEVHCGNGADDDCDGKIDCADSDCVGMPCRPDSECATRWTCTAAGACQGTPRPAGTVCRLAAGVCDVEERCDGTNPGCPADGFADEGRECRAGNGLCDPAERCDRTSPSCPADRFAVSGGGCEDDGNPCTGSRCDGAGACSHPSVANGTPCGQNGEVCTSGRCGCGSAATETSCTDGADNDCDGKIDCEDSNCVGERCDDDDMCTSDERCTSGGACGGGTPRDCGSSPGECFDDVGECQPWTGQCTFAFKPPDTPCGDDGLACTTDACDGVGFCVHAPRTGSPCDDGNECTSGEACNANGVCTDGSALECAAIDQCHDPGTCDPGTGSCSNPWKADGSDCDDGSACTRTDTCQSGGCVGANPVVCSDPDPCHPVGVCMPADGLCEYAPRNCDDGNPSTTEACHMALGCVYSPAGAYTNLVWWDDFESYAVGSFPSAWIADGNAGSDGANNKVDNSQAAAGSQSLKLFGALSGSWSALAFHSLGVSPPYEIELRIRPSSEPGSGNQGRAAVELTTGPSWTYLPRQYLLSMGMTTAVYSGGGTVSLGPCALDAWFTVRVRYELPDSSTVRLTYWYDGVYKGGETLATTGVEAQVAYLGVEVGTASTWYDEFRVFLPP